MEQSEVRVFPFYFGSSYYNMSERSEVQWNEQRHAFHLSFVLIHFTPLFFFVPFVCLIEAKEHAFISFLCLFLLQIKENKGHN